jgi:predicted GH43/DUF377 family glycosyl hydrolase
MNLVQKSVQQGGKLRPLIIPAEATGGTGLMNPSPFLDDDGELLLILRHINYTLYHSENDQRFPSVWGPLSYLHPEKDQRLVTQNFLCRLDDDYNITDYTLIDTTTLDVKPIWTFVGMEDARLVKWNGKYYGTGVRRDTTTNGVGRMELQELEIDKEAWTAKEISRVRIEAPIDKTSYCEKNWMPVLDKPFHYIKWTSPTELVEADPVIGESTQLSVVEGAKANADQRGGSQVLQWGEYYIAITHEVVLFKNYLKQKNGTYRHRLCVWDKDFKLIGLSPESWSFLDGQIEFVCGAAVVNDNLVVGFGFQDNAAFVLEVPHDLVNNMVEEALSYATV